MKNHGDGERVEVGPPKNGKARVVDVDPRTVAALTAHRAKLAEVDPRLGRNDALVLPGDDGGVRHPERFSRAFLARVRRAQKGHREREGLGTDALPVIRLHDVRHSHPTALLLAGVHPKVVQERLGHATISITLDIYSYVVLSMQRAAADSFAAAVFAG